MTDDKQTAGHETTVKLRIEAPGFYQYRTNESDPGLYVGHGIYPGPGFYHNMSTSCSFIQSFSITYILHLLRKWRNRLLFQQ